MTDGGLLDEEYVRARITGGDRSCSGHGATPTGSHLGTEICDFGDWQVIDLPISFGTAILKRTPR